MSPQQKWNLDREAAGCAQDIVSGAVKQPKVEASHVDNLVTKALGVLQENGLYACTLFLFSRTQAEEKRVAEVVRNELCKMAGELDEQFEFGWGKAGGSDAEMVLQYVSGKLCAQLDPLLMLKELWEQTLIYARYGAKARKAGEGS